MKLIYLDTETTGTGDTDRMIQLAYKVKGEEPVNLFFNPEADISFEAMAVHHITQKMLEGKPLFKNDNSFQELQVLLNDNILVAHNAAYDIGVLKREGINVPHYICTYKVASRYLNKNVRDGELSGHSLQYLRYALGIDLPDLNPHDALSDILLLESLFDYLCKYLPGPMECSDEAEMVAKMMEISSQPILLRKIRFGKHRGKTFAELAQTEASYLQWLSGQSDIDPDLRYTLNYYLNPANGVV